MIWYVIKNDLGEYLLIEKTDEIPEGWTFEVETANPEYIDYLNSLREIE